MTTGDKIKQFRINKGLKQYELAEKSGISRISIGYYERNERQPGTEQVERLAAALGVSPVDLIGWGYYDAKHPEKGKKLREESAFENYLSSLGYLISLHGETTEWHFEDMTDENGNVIGKGQVADDVESEYRLSKGKQAVIFTNAEFEELQRLTKEVIEARFYKKLLETKAKK